MFFEPFSDFNKKTPLNTYEVFLLKQDINLL